MLSTDIVNRRVISWRDCRVLYTWWCILSADDDSFLSLSDLHNARDDGSGPFDLDVKFSIEFDVKFSIELIVDKVSNDDIEFSIDDEFKFSKENFDVIFLPEAEVGDWGDGIGVVNNLRFVNASELLERGLDNNKLPSSNIVSSS